MPLRRLLHIHPMETRQRTPAEDNSSATSRLSRGRTLQGHIHQRFDLPPWVLLVQFFIGLGWLRAVAEKVIDPSWWEGAVLRDFLTGHADLALPWYRTFAETVIEPNLFVVAVTVVLAQLFAAVALLSGWRLSAGLAVGAFLNLNFMAAGAVNPSIFYLICQTALLLWILHGESGPKKRPLRLLATVSLLLVLLNVPFISTLDPAAVIEDPATVLVTLGLLTAVASRIGVHYSEEPRGSQPARTT